MEFRTDWMKPNGVDRRTGEADAFEGTVRRIKAKRYTHVRTSPTENSVQEVEIDASSFTKVCGPGVHRRFHVDARRVKRIRLIISDEKFEGSRGHRDLNHLNLRGFGAPEALAQCKTIYWCVETEE